MSSQKNEGVEDLVASIFEQAISERASDVHFETLTDSLRVRFRIDGVLEDKFNLPSTQTESVINSIKVVADLDITNHDSPQDGHFELYQFVNSDDDKKESGPLANIGEKFKGILSKANSGISGDGQSENFKNPSKNSQRVLDVRISVYPSVNGEVIVARILNRPDALISLADHGMEPDTLESIHNIIGRDSGMILITGPAGSGKTTTLYSILQELKSKEKNIMTIEDPVEFHLDWLRQTELKPDRGFTFERAMRSILRQDPDVIMIGEIRDKETAEHAISVSLIGRIVGATVHSNSTIGTIARLIDMNIDRSMIAYAINGVISRRLVRRVCDSCKVEYVPDQKRLAYFGLNLPGQKFYKGKGCDACRQTGYSGRVGIFEVLEFNSAFRSLIVSKAPMSDLENYMNNSGVRTLKLDAVEKVTKGVTTIEEISKIV